MMSSQLNPSAPAMLVVAHLVKRYGEMTVTDDVSLTVNDRELHAIIGPNGAGKTSLIHQLSGELESASGDIWFSGENISRLPAHERARRGLLRTFQITSVFDHFTVLENATLAALGTRARFPGLWRSLLQNSTLVACAHSALEAVRLAAHADTLVSEISYGERRQLELAMALAAKPKFLLLDEPMAGMSSQESAVVIGLLRALKEDYGILLIEHDMDAVFSLADRITVLVNGRVMFTGTPDEIREHPEVRAVYLGEDDNASDGGVRL